MCMIDDGTDRCATLMDKWQKARKAHRCGECGRVISAGEQYRIFRGASDGSAFTHKTCAHCQVACDWLKRECDGYTFGYALEDIADHETSEYPELAGLVAGMKAQWKTTTGDLMPIPARGE
jgi:hypothetical protein